ncbi:MAG: hypothetical protein ACKO3W_06575 [bacterium]
MDLTSAASSCSARRPNRPMGTRWAATSVACVLSSLVLCDVVFRTPAAAAAGRVQDQQRSPAEEPPRGQQGASGATAPQSDETAPRDAGAPEDLLRGPKVPELDVKSDRPYVEGAKDVEKLSKPVLEQRVYFRTIDLMGFDDATKERIDAFRVAYVERVERFQKDAQKRRMELEAKRRLANPAEPPSEEFKRAMNAIEAERPKLVELQAQVNDAVGTDRARELEKRFADELKRVRAEQTRLTEEERKRRRAQMEEAKKAKQSGETTQTARATR